MGNFLNILKAIFSGYITGIIVSLPLGPAGIESIRRTISKNFKEGFLVSLGAISADVSYMLLINRGILNCLSGNIRRECLFWIISGFILSMTGYFSLRNEKIDLNIINNNNCSMPFLTGFLITFLNPMTPSLWITLSGTIIRRWHHVGNPSYYIFISSIIAGMLTWFALLNYFALKGINLLGTHATNNTSKLLNIFIFLLGIGFIIFGFIRLF